MSIDTGNLEAYLTLLESADAAINRDAAAALAQTTKQLLSYTESIEHVVSGDMRDSTYSLGPFSIGDGMLESTIQSAADYTIFELTHGGEHDWASRTVIEQAALLDALQEQTGRIVATALGGGY